MRTIKFRGRSRKTGEWLVGDLLQVANEVFIAPSDGDWFDFIPWSKNNVFHLPSATYEVIPDTIGQFTGLLDKNGEEIYEGDIIVRVSLDVFAENHNIPIDILRDEEYKRGKYIVGHGGGFFTLESEKRVSLRLWLDCNDYQVIGNIHDNPELLTLNK